MPKILTRFFGWIHQTIVTLCNRPDHLQRLSVIGAGMWTGGMIVALVAILVWFGTKGPALALAVVPILGNALYMVIGAFIVCIIVIIGLIKGLSTLRAMLPGGATFEVLATSTTQGTVETLEVVTKPSGATVETATTSTVTQTPAPGDTL